MRKQVPLGERFDVVLIRKSTHAQDDRAQADNVAAMLKAEGVYVSDEHWFTVTVTRANVQGNDDFQKIMKLVEENRVRTAYVESQDRFGTDDVFELFTLLGVLRAHGTRLFDLTNKADLTGKDDATQIRAFLGGLKSQKEREDQAQRSLRSRVQNFQRTGSWPNGPEPYGYGKRCYSAAPEDGGKLLWEWQPVHRAKARKGSSTPPTGQLHVPDADGTLRPSGPADVRIPRKAKDQVTRLVPSKDAARVRAVKLVYDLYVRLGLSRRQICARLNAEGFTSNGGPFTHVDITGILRNPAYVGDTYFGKVQSGRHYTFDARGLLVKVDGHADETRRDHSECLVKRDTHEGLVDRKTWGLAREKLSDEKARRSFSPRNPAYWLKQLLVCGHCEKGLIGRTEADPKTRARKVVYVCSTYLRGLCNGHASPCGGYRITHEDAERLLLDKIAELSLPFEETAGAGARENLKARLERLGHDGEDAEWKFDAWVEEGITAFVSYLKTTYHMRPEALRRLEKSARSLYLMGKLTKVQVASLPATPAAPLPDVAAANEVYSLTPEHKAALAAFKAALKEAEDAAVAEARKKLAELREEHKTLTKNWAKATDAMQAVLKEELEKIEAEMTALSSQTVPLRERFKALYAAEKEREVERKKLLAEWPTLEAREKGEALRRLFKTVTLFWEKTWHPREGKPAKPRKTDRPGRYSYELKRDRIGWTFTASGLETAS
jgi:hypothetical protein